MIIKREVGSNERKEICHVYQIRVGAARLEISCSVQLRGKGGGGTDSGSCNYNVPSGGRSRAKSQTVGDAERKQLTDGLILLKQKTSSPLGFIYSVESSRKRDMTLTMDFNGSTNITVVEDKDMKVAVNWVLIELSLGRGIIGRD